MRETMPNMNDNKAFCPICNSKEKLVLAEYNSDDSLKHLSISPFNDGYKELKSQIIERWGGDVCHFVECTNCKFNYAVPFVAGSSELYSFFYNAPQMLATLNWEHILAKDLILRKFGPQNLKDKNLMEFGPSGGGFVKDIANSGFETKNIVCIESSENCINALNDFGIKCLPSDLSKINSNEIKNKFNVIVLFQVLEHLDNIDKTFNFINKIADKNANIFIAVPNNIIRRFYEKSGIFVDVPTINVSRWNENNFKLVGEKYGWMVKYHEIQKVSFFACAYEYIWYKYLTRSIGKIKKRYVRKSLIAILLIPLFTINLFKIINIKTNSNGTSQLVHLEKI